MRTIYIDSELHCHVTDDGTMTAVETTFFDGKCDTFVEGYCCDPEKRAIYPWKPYTELESAQREHEQQLIEEYESLINELYSEVTE